MNTNAIRAKRSRPLRTGLRIRGERGHPEVRGALIRYVSWLRERRDFPIRVPVYLLPGETLATVDRELAVASFFAPFDRTVEPYIRIATGDYPALKREHGRDNALASYITSLNHELIHYWQWLKTGDTWERGVVNQSIKMLHKYEAAVDRP